MTKTFYLYMMTNRSRVVLYTGITNSLVRRVWEHQNGDIEGFTKKYRVNRLVYYENFDDPRHAISREKEIKGWRRAKKNALVETKNPKWADLSPMLFRHMRVPRVARDDGKRRRVVLSNAKDHTVEMSIFSHHLRANGVAILHSGLGASIRYLRSLVVFATRDDSERKVI